MSEETNTGWIINRDDIDYLEVGFDIAQNGAMVVWGGAIGMRLLGQRLFGYCGQSFLTFNECQVGIIQTTNQLVLAAAFVGFVLFLIGVTLPMVLGRVES